MKLYLLRHGPAEDVQDWETDSERPLTTEGRSKTKQAAAGIAPAIREISVLASSPYLRALDTAKIYAAELKYRGEIVQSTDLTPDSSISRATAFIDSLMKHDSALIVGHQPLLSTLTSTLIGSSRPVIEFKKGALARLEYFGSHYPAVLEWLITAKLQAH